MQYSLVGSRFVLQYKLYCDWARDMGSAVLQYSHCTCDTALGWARGARGRAAGALRVLAQGAQQARAGAGRAGASGRGGAGARGTGARGRGAAGAHGLGAGCAA